MSVFNRYGIFVQRIGDMLLRNCGSAAHSPSNVVGEPIPGGGVDRSAVITSHADPVSRFMTTDLQVLLAGTPAMSLLTGYAFDTATTPPGSSGVTAATLLQCQARLDGAVFDSASNHFTITSSKGYAQIEDITLTQDDPSGGKANITCWHLSADGIATPDTAAANASLVSTPLWTSTFFLGPVTLGNPASSPVWFKSVQSVSIRTGLTYVTKRGEGQPYASIGSIIRRTPEIRVRIHDAEEWYTKMSPALHGLALTGALRVNCYLQKGIHGSTRTPYATAEHMNIYAATGALDPQDFSVAGEDDLGIELLIRPTGTLALANNVAILTA